MKIKAKKTKKHKFINNSKAKIFLKKFYLFKITEKFILS